MAALFFVHHTIRVWRVVGRRLQLFAFPEYFLIVVKLEMILVISLCFTKIISCIRPFW